MNDETDPCRISPVVKYIESSLSHTHTHSTHLWLTFITSLESHLNFSPSFSPWFCSLLRGVKKILDSRFFHYHRLSFPLTAPILTLVPPLSLILICAVVFIYVEETEILAAKLI